MQASIAGSAQQISRARVAAKANAALPPMGPPDGPPPELEENDDEKTDAIVIEAHLFC